MDHLADARQLDSLTGKEFEELIVRLIRKLGLQVEFQSGGPDGGIDILAKSEADLVSGYYVIQCKRYSGKVGVGAVRDLFGVISDKRANKGILITNTEFTRAAVEFASDKPIELIGGRKLSKLLEEHLGQMFRTNGEAVTLPPSVLAFGKFVTKKLTKLKKMIDEQQVEIDNGLILLKPITLKSRDEAVNFCRQHRDRFSNTAQVFINQVSHFLEEYTDADWQEVERGFVLVERTLKKLLSLQKEIYSVQLGEYTILEPIVNQIKRVYLTLFEIFSDSWADQVNKINDALDSPERFVVEKNLQPPKTGEETQGSRTPVSLVGVASEIHLEKFSEELEKLDAIFRTTLGRY